MSAVVEKRLDQVAAYVNVLNGGWRPSITFADVTVVDDDAERAESPAAATLGAGRHGEPAARRRAAQAVQRRRDGLRPGGAVRGARRRAVPRRRLAQRRALAVVVPAPLRIEAMRAAHDDPLAGHMGVEKTCRASTAMSSSTSTSVSCAPRTRRAAPAAAACWSTSWQAPRRPLARSAPCRTSSSARRRGGAGARRLHATRRRCPGSRNACIQACHASRGTESGLEPVEI